MALYNSTCPQLGDDEVVLLSKIAQSLCSGGGTSGGVSSISVNGGALQTGAVSLTIPAATPALLNFQDTNGAADASVFINSGATEIIKVTGSSTFIQLATTRIHRNNATSAIALLSGTGKSDGAFFEANSDGSGSPGFITATSKGTGAFRVINAPFASTVGVVRLEVNSAGNVLGIAGTAAAPTYSAIADPDTGTYFPAANAIGFSTAGVLALTITSTGVAIHEAPVRLKGYTVATLPAGTQGDTAFVTDATAPAFLAAAVGGGAVVSSVFFNGATWVTA